MSGPWAAHPGTIRHRLQRWLHANPGSTVAEIQRALGITERQTRSAVQDAMRCEVVTRAAGLPVRYTCAAPQHLEIRTVGAAIQRLAARPDGVTVLQAIAATNASESRVRQVLGQLRSAGALVAHRTGKSCRYFSSTQDAIAWQHRQQRPAQPAGARIAPPRPRVGDALMTERTRVTVCPSIDHDPRYQLPPGSRPHGAGFAAAGIGRDIETGRAWS